MNFEFSYHICLRNEYFETLKLKEGGVVRLGSMSVRLTLTPSTHRYPLQHNLISYGCQKENKYPYFTLLVETILFYIITLYFLFNLCYIVYFEFLF